MSEVTTINELKEYLDVKISTLATKDDIKNMATKDDLKNMATKDDIMLVEEKFSLVAGMFEEVKVEISEVKTKIDKVQESVNRLEKVTFEDSNLYSNNIIKLDGRTTNLEKHVGLEPQSLAQPA
jgi:hypothetical protein